MLFEDGYNYTLLDQVGYDMQYLEAKRNNFSIKIYIKVFYRINNKVETKDIYEFKDLGRLDNIIVKYFIEELDMIESSFHSMYKSSKCYKVKNLGCFKKWISDFDDYEEIENIDNDEIYEIIKKYDATYKEDSNDEDFLQHQNKN